MGHFTAEKREGSVQFQYGEWLKAVRGSPQSPQRKTSPSGSKGDGDGHEHVEKTGGAPPHKDKEMAAQEEQGWNPSRITVSEKGNNMYHESVPDFQQDSHVTASITEINVEREVMGEMAKVNHELMLNRSDDLANLKVDGHKVNGADGVSIRPKPKWTRIVRMESGPVSSEGNNCKEQLGKRKAIQYTDEANYEDVKAMGLKQQNMDGQQIIVTDRLARVETHPCWEQ